MKKTISLIIAVLMLVCSLPIASFAAETIPVTNDLLDENSYVLTGNTVYTVPEGETLVIPSGETLYLETGVIFNVYGTLDVEGRVISRGGVITFKYVDENTCGTVINPVNVCGNDASNYRAEVLIKSLPASYTTSTHYVTKPTWTCSTDGDAYADITASFSQTAYDTVITATLNQYFAFKVKLYGKDGTKTIDKYDSSLLTFKFKGFTVSSEQGVNRFLVTGAGAVTFAGHKLTGKTEWPDEVLESEYSYLKRFSIYLPSGSGYSVYGVSGEASADSETVKLKYGQEFIFRVQIDEKYDDSDYTVYCINTYKWNDDKNSETLEVLAQNNTEWVSANGDEQKLCVKTFQKGNSGLYIDENGYYHIPAEMMLTDCTIAVEGVVSNETLSLAARIMEIIKSVISVIEGFFAKIFK